MFENRIIANFDVNPYFNSKAQRRLVKATRYNPFITIITIIIILSSYLSHI